MNQTMKECYLYKKLPQNKVQCRTCNHYCLIENEKTGKCGVRKNENGKLYSLVYGQPCAINIDPIEKKPLYHFLPNTKTLSLACPGCNFKCLACQNYEISQVVPKPDFGSFPEVGLRDIVEMAKKNNCPSISYTYTEPTVFLEYAFDIMKIAKKAGLKNIWVSNGFFSPETFDLMLPPSAGSGQALLNAANIDLKSFDDEFYQKICGARLQPVLDNLKRLKDAGIWLEITTLIIPTLNDKKEIFENIANFIKKELGDATPWHISRFCGAISWKLQNIPDTPLETLKKVRQIGKEAGLKYVYIGNVPGLDSEDTFCPKCNSKMIERTGYLITRFDKNGNCANCGEYLNLIG